MESQYAVLLMNIFLATLFAHNLMEARTGLFKMMSVGTIDLSVVCSRIPKLSPKQISICEEKPKLMNCILKGYKLAAKECQYQFRKSRWNCTLLGQESEFDEKAIPGTREAAYTQAINSAGVVYAVTEACSRGNLSECHCDQSLLGTKSRKGWTWGGCSVDTSYGSNLSKSFVNARQSTHDAIYLMNKHNNRAGRQVVKDQLVIECKCHGLSGSCTTRTCWKALPTFRKIGDALKRHYHKAVRVKPMMKNSNGGLKPESLVLQSDDEKKPRNHRLVYLNDSKSYCARDTRLGMLGTHDRQCNVTTTDQDYKCSSLCCGRGHNTHNYTRVSQCRCEFHWCCEVKCSSCVENVVIHTCK